MMPNGPSQLLQPNCARMLRRALRAHEHGEFDKAERLYTAVLHIHPDQFRRAARSRPHQLPARAARCGAGADPGGAQGRPRPRRWICKPRPGFSRAQAIRARAQKLRRRPAPCAGRRRASQPARRGAARAWPSARRAGKFRARARGRSRSSRCARQPRQCADQAQSSRRGACELRQGADDRARQRAAPHQPRRRAAPARSPARGGDERAPRAGQPAGFRPGQIRRGRRPIDAGRFFRLARLRSALGRWLSGVAPAQFRRAAVARRVNRSTAKPFCCTPSRVLAIRCSSCATRRSFAGRGANVILEVQPELARLLSPLPGVAAVIARGKPLPRFDCHCPLLSLPLAFATELATIPAQIPYIAPADQDVALWRERLPRRGPLIGLVWSGERSHDNDRNRSLRLETLLPLLRTPDVTFVSLQHEVRDEDAALLQEQSGRRSRRRSVPRFRRYCRRDLAARRGDLGGHRGRAPRRRHGQTAFAVAAVRRRLPLAARARRQPVVSDRAAVSPAGNSAIGQSVIEALRRELTRADFSPRMHKLSA